MATLKSSAHAPDDAVLRTGNDDLAARAAALGISHLMPCISTLSQNIPAQIVPVCAARRLQERGFDVAGYGNFDHSLSINKYSAYPDVTTLTSLPWDKEIGWLACDVNAVNVPYEKCPRRTLKRVIDRVKEAGYDTKCGIELEFTLLKKDSFEVLDLSERNDYNIGTIMNYSKFSKRILNYMTELGWNPYMMEQEHNACQLEVNFDSADALTAADRFIFAKFMIKEIAKDEGYRACFMPATESKFIVGNGGHINVSLWNDDKNTFHDPSGELSMSDVGRHFLSGVLHNASGMCALVCPTVNSYKRLHGHANAYNVISYSDRGFLVAVRSQTGQRLELRFPDCSMNPYLALSSVLAAGLDGIVRKLPLDTNMRMDDDVFYLPPITTRPKLPLHLEDALRHLQKNAAMNEYLGTSLIDDYVTIKQSNWRKYLSFITEWEKQFVDSY